MRASSHIEQSADNSSLCHLPGPKAAQVHRFAHWLTKWHHLQLHAGQWISSLRNHALLCVNVILNFVFVFFFMYFKFFIYEEKLADLMAAAKHKTLEDWWSN